MLVQLNSEEGVQVVGIHLTEFSESVLLVTLGILIVSLFRIMFAKVPQKLKIMPESGVVILLGCIFGGIILGIGWEDNELITFNPEIFFVSFLIFYYLLTPCIHLLISFFLNKNLFFLAYSYSSCYI